MSGLWSRRINQEHRLTYCTKTLVSSRTTKAFSDRLIPICWRNCFRFHNKIPVIQAVIKQAIEPAIKALIPNLAKSD